MLENLRIAFRKQRKLVLIFLLTIFLPAVTLGVFGVRAIRSERFRQARQEENEGRRAARFIRTQLQAKLEAMARVLGEAARESAVLDQDLAAVHDLTVKRIAADPLAGQAILLYRNEPALFPLLQIPNRQGIASRPGTNDASLAERIRQAEALEFVAGDYGAAAATYRDLAALTEGKNAQAEMLMRQARCLMRAQDYKEAVRVSGRIVSEYPDGLTPSGLRLGLLARLQSVECYERLRDPEGATRSALEGYRDLLAKPTDIGVDQFKTYVALIEEAIDTLIAGELGPRIPADLREAYGELKRGRETRLKEWEAVSLLKREVVPDLERRLELDSSHGTEPYRFSRLVDGRYILFLGAWVPERDGKKAAGIFGIQVNGERLAQEVFGEALTGAGLTEGSEAVLADVTGRPLSDKRSPAGAIPLAAEFFDGNFPPWKIEVFKGAAPGPGILDLRRNFYFWTILTLVVVLVFGALLIGRTIGQEMEILKIKSDFVSSVSHEFKTPLTSIGALMERLVDGKVRDPAKMDRYFGIIAQDTARLTRLVNNLLDFSKIEEGKKEYVFAETDVVRIAVEQVEAFGKDQVEAGPEIRLEVAGEIPPLHADADALSRALANLLSNAVKFSPPGKAVRVGLRRDGENIVLDVEDQGIGIHPDDVDRVFEKFFQGRNALDRSVRGTGLGLTLVRHIAEAHGGKVFVESRVGQGSTFSIILPIGS